MRIKSRLIPAVVTGTLMILAVCGSKAVIHGAQEGMNLCMQVIIPSIFPFLFLAMIMCNYWKGVNIPVLKPLCHAVGIPSEYQSILLLAMIGGYPIGAQAVAQARNNGSISSQNAQRLLGFCNNAGPSFIFGLMRTMFDNPFAPILLWFIHIGAAIIVGYVLPNKHCQCQPMDQNQTENISQILKNALRVTAVICGWVILFRILICLFSNWTANMNPLHRSVMIGLLELSNGSISLHEIPTESVRFIAAAALLSAGGLCVVTQTKSVVGNIRMGMYFCGKLMQIALSIILSTLISSFLYHTSLYLFPLLISVFCFCVIVVSIRRKKVVAL